MPAVVSFMPLHSQLTVLERLVAEVVCSITWIQFSVHINVNHGVISPSSSLSSSLN